MKKLNLENILKLLKEGETKVSIAKLYGVSRGALDSYLKANNVFVRIKPPDFSREEKALLIEKYPTSSHESLMELFPNRSIELLRRKASQCKIKREVLETREASYSESEVRFLKKNYHTGSKEDILTNLERRNWQGIQAKASSLGLSREDPRSFSQIELDTLKKYYSELKAEKLSSLLPKHTWKSIQGKAQELKLKRNTAYIYRDKLKSRVGILLKDTPETFYWVGFLLADGHITDKKLSVSLSVKDIEHLKKFCKYVKCTSNLRERDSKFGLKDYKKLSRVVRIGIHNKYLLSKIIAKFDLKPRKTYDPPDVEIYKQFDIELLTCLFIGFIDGDGWISRNRIGIEARIEWLSWFEQLISIFKDLLDLNIPNPRKRNDRPTMCTFGCGKRVFRTYLLETIDKHNLPVLERKWDKLR